MPYVSINVDVDLPLDEVLEDVDLDDIRDYLRTHSEETDSPQIEPIVERAYLKARTMTDLPTELKDLFWHVHGRALA